MNGIERIYHKNLDNLPEEFYNEKHETNIF